MFSSWTGATIKNVPLDPEDFRLDVKGILEAVDADTRLLFLTSPNNPTGSYIPKSTISTLLDQLPDHVLVIFDEVYHHFAQTHDYTTALSYVQSGYPVVAINSFSKAYGLAALRIGYGYTTTEISAYLRKLIRPFLINKLSLTAARAALEDQQFIQDTVRQISEQREQLRNELNKLNITSWPSHANFILVKVPDRVEQVVQNMEKEGVMVRDGSSFGAPGCIRITIGDEAATSATVAAFATILGH